MENKEEIIIDGTNAVLGRLASFAAKQALLGKKVIIVNSEKVIIVGNKKDILEKYKTRRARGGSGLKGPFFPKEADKILKRTIRGMLDYKRGRGRNAFKNIKCFCGLPKEFEDKKMIKSGRKKKGITLEEVSKELKGGK